MTLPTLPLAPLSPHAKPTQRSVSPQRLDHSVERSLCGRADLHLHTSYSDGQPTVRQVLTHVATCTDLDVIAVTDHDTISGALEARRLASAYGVRVIVGEEVSTRAGHIVGLFLEKAIPAGLSAELTISAIHAQGGLAFAAHPFLRSTRLLSGKGLAMLGVGTAIADLDLDGVEVDNSTPFLEWANEQARRFNARYSRLPELGNSDAHITVAIGKSFTRFAGHTEDDLYRALRDGLVAAGAQRYSPAELLSYLGFWRAGRRGVWKAQHQRRQLAEQTAASSAAVRLVQ